MRTRSLAVWIGRVLLLLVVLLLLLLILLGVPGIDRPALLTEARIDGRTAR